jgi:hypothetical protein
MENLFEQPPWKQSDISNSECKMIELKFCIFNFAFCIALTLAVGAAYADHERAVRAPWSPQFEAERLAVMDVPEVWSRFRPGGL